MIRSIETERDVKLLYEQMQSLYGEQSHIPHELLLKAAAHYPELFRLGFDRENNLVSHLIALPLNPIGAQKMQDDSTYEEDFRVGDFYFEQSESEKLSIFIYSIYGKSDFLAAKMIRSLYQAIVNLNAKCHKESLLFAECVSPQGKRISESMGLARYQTYVFDGEELFLYRLGLEEFIEVNGQRASLLNS